MIDVYVKPTTQTQRVTIMLEECGLAYRPIEIEWGSEDPVYVATGARGRVPAIVDHDTPDGKLMAMTQSNAILLYLSGKAGGALVPTEPRARARCYEWMMMLATDFYPPFAAVYWMSWRKPEPFVEAAQWFEDRMIAECEAFDRHMADKAFAAGGEYSIADVAGYAQFRLAVEDFPALRRFANVARWMERVAARPAVQRGLAACGQGRPPGAIASRSA